MPGDVDERAADAHHREEDEREARGSARQREQRERDPQDGEPEAEVAREPLARRERDAGEPRRGRRRSPSAVFSQPTPALPASSIRIASTTITHLERAGDEHLRAVNPTTTCRRRSARDRAEAGEQLRADRARRPVRAGGVSGGSPSTQAADQRYAPPVSAKTSDGPLTARSTPPIAGPANMPTLEIVFSARFDAVSSSGVRRERRRSAACAGWNAVEMTDIDDRERVGDERRAAGRGDHGHCADEERRARGRRRASPGGARRGRRAGRARGRRPAASDQRAKRTIPTALAPSAR